MAHEMELGTFNNRLMNGLDFCKKVYDLFDQIRKSPGGDDRLRDRKSKKEKKLVEELFPIARYIQACYSPGRCLKVRWIDGNQQFDARLLSSGVLVNGGFVPRRQCLEVTTVVHENDHLLRTLLSEQGLAFGVKGVRRGSKTRRIVSQPHVYQGQEASNDLASKIADRIKAKNKKSYPRGTVLVIQCELDRPLMEQAEWQFALQEVKSLNIQHKFREVYVLDSNCHHSTTLYGGR